MSARDSHTSDMVSPQANTDSAKRVDENEGTNTSTFKIPPDELEASAARKLNAFAAEFIPASGGVDTGKGDQKGGGMPLSLDSFLNDLEYKSFAPQRRKGSSKLRKLQLEAIRLTRAAGQLGILVSEFSDRYLEKFNVELEISSEKDESGSPLFSNVSDLLESVHQFVSVIDKPEERENPPPVKQLSRIFVPLGPYKDKLVVDQYIYTMGQEVELFRSLIVEVIEEFCVRNMARSNHPMTQQALEMAEGEESRGTSGLALSLFAAEWDRFYAGRHDLKLFREKFNVQKLMPFLLTIPEIEVVGNHPEVRVRVRDMVGCLKAAEKRTAENPDFGKGGSSPRPQAPQVPPMRPPVGEGGYGGMGGYMGSMNPFMFNPHAQALAAHMSMNPYSFGMGAMGFPMHGVPPPPHFMPPRMPHFMGAGGADKMSSPSGQAPDPAASLLQLLKKQGSSSGFDLEGSLPPEQAWKYPKSKPVALSKVEVMTLMYALVDKFCQTQAQKWTVDEDYLSDFDGEGESDDQVRDRWLERKKLHKNTDFLGNPDGDFVELKSKRSEKVGVLVSSLKRRWTKEYSECCPLSFYLHYFRLQKVPNLLMEVSGLVCVGQGLFMRVSTVEHARKFCQSYPPPPPLYSEEVSVLARLSQPDFEPKQTSLLSASDARDLKQALHSALFKLISKVCQKQQLVKLISKVEEGDPEAAALLAKYRSLSKRVQGGTDQVELAKGKSSLSMIGLLYSLPEAEGLTLKQIEFEWFCRYFAHLRCFSDQALYPSLQTLLDEIAGLALRFTGGAIRVVATGGCNWSEEARVGDVTPISKQIGHAFGLTSPLQYASKPICISDNFKLDLEPSQEDGPVPAPQSSPNAKFQQELLSTLFGGQLGPQESNQVLESLLQITKGSLGTSQGGEEQGGRISSSPSPNGNSGLGSFKPEDLVALLLGGEKEKTELPPPASQPAVVEKSPGLPTLNLQTPKNGEFTGAGVFSSKGEEGRSKADVEMESLLMQLGAFPKSDLPDKPDSLNLAVQPHEQVEEEEGGFDLDDQAQLEAIDRLLEGNADLLEPRTTDVSPAKISRNLNVEMKLVPKEIKSEDKAKDETCITQAALARIVDLGVPTPSVSDPDPDFSIESLLFARNLLQAEGDLDQCPREIASLRTALDAEFLRFKKIQQAAAAAAQRKEAEEKWIS